jgi:hypothetical protein
LNVTDLRLQRRVVIDPRFHFVSRRRLYPVSFYRVCADFFLLAPAAGWLVRKWRFPDTTGETSLASKAVAGCVGLCFVAVACFWFPSVDGDLNWIQTYNAYLGPALRVLQGGVPMVDVFCQYGILPYLLFSLAFSTVLPVSYPSAAFVASAVNAIYVGVASGMLLKASRSGAVAAVLAAVLAEWGRNSVQRRSSVHAADACLPRDRPLQKASFRAWHRSAYYLSALER